jgi:hypothetical protein
LKPIKLYHNTIDYQLCDTGAYHIYDMKLPVHLYENQKIKKYLYQLEWVLNSYFLFKMLLLEYLNNQFNTIIMMRKKKYSGIDDKTLENMKRYYKLENHDELLQFIKKNNVLRGDDEHDKRR